VLEIGKSVSRASTNLHDSIPSGTIRSQRQRTTTNDRFMKITDTQRQVSEAIAACQEKKAEELTILELEKGSGAFTDYFVVCSGTNPRQIQAIADEVELRLKRTGLYPAHIEGYRQAEWVLLDYVDFVVHVFAEKARRYYELERLWKSAKRLEPADLKTPAKRAAKKRNTVAAPRRKRA
jgi:ribosome-associated protein